MELKSWAKLVGELLDDVLIVPLWNWNRKAMIKEYLQYVLIVPLWNWNSKYKTNVERKAGFNRTFMELKCNNPETGGSNF